MEAMIVCYFATNDDEYAVIAECDWDLFEGQKIYDQKFITLLFKGVRSVCIEYDGISAPEPVFHTGSFSYERLHKGMYTIEISVNPMITIKATSVEVCTHCAPYVERYKELCRDKLRILR